MRDAWMRDPQGGRNEFRCVTSVGQMTVKDLHGGEGHEGREDGEAGWGGVECGMEPGDEAGRRLGGLVYGLVPASQP